MTETLQEFFDSRGVQMRVDAPSGVIHGVKILGLKSRNGRTYLPQALANSVRLYENARVNVNHPKGNPLRPRDYQDRIGVIRNVGVKAGEGLFADFHFNPKHALAEQLAWDAEHAPQNVGFSHNVQAETVRRGDSVVVEAITRVQSVDLVADPATTQGLFESNGGKGEESRAERTTAELTLDDLKRDSPHLVEEIRNERAAELNGLQAEVERLTALEAARQKHQTIRRLLREFQLPDPESTDSRAKSIVSGRFIELLLAADGEVEIRRLIEERAALVRSLRPAGNARPLSRDQHVLDGPARSGTKGFVEAIT